MLETALQLLVWRWQPSMLESAQLSLSARVLNSMKEISKLLNLGGRVRRDPGTRPVPTRKLKMTGYRVIKFHFESNETQPRMKRTANKVKDPINPSTENHFLSFMEESEQEQMQ